MKNFVCGYFNHFEGKLRLEKISATDELEASKIFILKTTDEEGYKEHIRRFNSLSNFQEHLLNCDIDFSVIEV